MANEIYFPTGIGAAENDNGVSVYVNTVHGAINEIREGKVNKIADAKIGAPVCAMKWGGKGVRVYYINHESRVQEACTDDGKSWYNGNLSSAKHEAAAYGSIGACQWSSDQIRVYYQQKNNTIQELTWSGGKWGSGTNFGAALAGTAIAVTGWAGKHMRVYYQDPSLKIMEKCWDDGGKGWYTGGLSVQSNVTRCNIGVTSWGEGSSLGIRVYYAHADNTIKEKAWDGGGNWYDGGFSHQSVPGSRVAATPQPKLRVFFQDGALKSAALTEMVWSNGWHASKDALPSHVE